MYRILIADDEKEERNVIRYLLNRFNFELEIVEAANGRAALAQLQEQPVDILFTDVKMPFLDGIELATEVRSLYPNIEIIFFSGHDDFDFIKKALSLKADNYILKPINPDEFQHTIQTALENIRNKEAVNKQDAVNREFLKNHILYRMLNKTPMEVLRNEYASIDMSFLDEYSHMILLHSDESFFDSLSETDSLFFYKQIIEAIPNNQFDLINLNPYQIILLFKNNTNKLISYKQLASQIQKHIYAQYGVNCFLSVSNELSHSSQIPIVYEELEKHLNGRFFYSESYIYPIDSPLKEHEEYQEQNEHLLQEIQTAIEQVDIVKIRESVNSLIQHYDKNLDTSHVYVRFLFSRLLQSLCQVLPEYDRNSINNHIEAIYSCKHFSEIKDVLANVLEEVMKKLAEKENSSRHVIDVVKQYIHENLSEDLSLDSLAEKVYLTPGYLSEKFRKETGWGINKYIKYVRMEKGKELLYHTNMKVNNIGQTVGYTNVSYFCKSFREHFGTSPKKYREKSKTIGK
ncbi:response regulator [Gracilibacillus oryzae]|nr:response regulator [Gracilibacillus oryzae]